MFVVALEHFNEWIYVFGFVVVVVVVVVIAHNIYTRKTNDWAVDCSCSSLLLHFCQQRIR